MQRRELEREVKERLNIGQWYEFKSIHKTGNDIEKHYKRMQCIGIYPHIAEFRDKKGIRRSYDYFDIYCMLRGEEIIC